MFGEIAAITGNEQVVSEVRHMTCILRENLEQKAKENGEALLLTAALMEKPFGEKRTYAEIIFNLNTLQEKETWFQRYGFVSMFRTSYRVWLT